MVARIKTKMIMNGIPQYLIFTFVEPEIIFLRKTNPRIIRNRISNGRIEIPINSIDMLRTTGV
jgi:hypothetical protein